MRIFFFGYSSAGFSALETLLEAGHSIVGVCTHTRRDDDPPGFASVAELARTRGLEAIAIPQGSWPQGSWPQGSWPQETCGRGVTEKVASDAPFGPPGSPHAEVEHRVRTLRPDLILSASFRTLIPKTLVDVPERGAVNLHPSLLPRYRGRAPLNWVLVHGETETGITLHHMTPDADAGDIIGQERLPIGEDETAPELARRLEAAGCALLRTYLPRLEDGTAPRHPQDTALSTNCGRRRPRDGHFEWSWTRRRIHNLVRAVTRPFPGAFTPHGDGRLFVWKTGLAGSPPRALQPGEFLNSAAGPPTRPSPSAGNAPTGPGPSTRVGGSMWVGAGDGSLELLDWAYEP